MDSFYSYSPEGISVPLNDTYAKCNDPSNVAEKIPRSTILKNFLLSVINET